MERVINIKPIKREFTNVRGYKKTNWTCELEVHKFDGSIQTIGGIQFMDPQKLKRDAIKEAKKYKEYILSKGEFYFI